MSLVNRRDFISFSSKLFDILHSLTKTAEDSVSVIDALVNPSEDVEGEVIDGMSNNIKNFLEGLDINQVNRQANIVNQNSVFFMHHKNPKSLYYNVFKNTKTFAKDLENAFAYTLLTSNVFGEIMGNVSNTIIFRHYRIKDRKISVVNSKLREDIKKKVEKNFSKFRTINQEMYETLALSKKNHYDLSDNITGFIKGKSYIDHASKHLGSESILTVDINKFYDSISLDKVIVNKMVFNFLYSLFEVKFGIPYEEEAFENSVYKDIIDKQFSMIHYYYILLLNFYTHNGLLPTGSSYSPVISNLIFLPIDLSILKYSNENDLIYTRYADDICLSSVSRNDNQGAYKISIDTAKDLECIVNKHSFYLKYDKTKIMGPGHKKKIAGLILSDVDGKQKLSIGTKRKLEIKNSIDGKDWNDLSNQELGLLSWISNVNRDQFDFISSGLLGAKKINNSPSTQGRYV